MTSQTMDSIKKALGTNAIVFVFLATVAAVLLFSTSNGLFSGTNGHDALNAFAQEQNQTTAASGNNNAANTTTTAAATEAASNYNEMLNPRQIEYPALLGFNDLHIEAIRHIDPNATQGNQQQQQDIFNLIVHHHCKVYDDMTATCLLFPTGMNDQDKLYGIE